jgi:hypothetical protein
MRNLFHQTLGFVLGLAFGLMGVVTAVSLFAAYVLSEPKKKPPRKNYQDFLDSRKFSHDEFLASHGQKKEEEPA